MCRLEESGNGSVVRGALNEMVASLRIRKGKEENLAGEAEAYDMGEVARLMQGVSVYSFRDGMQTLTDAMEKHLREQDNVDIVQGDAAVSLTKSVNADSFQVRSLSSS